MKLVTFFVVLVLLTGCSATPEQRAQFMQQLQQTSQNFRQGAENIYQNTPKVQSQQNPTWGFQNQKKERNIQCYRATDGILRCWE